MFTLENTDGYTQSQLDELNVQLDAEKLRLGFYETEDEWKREQIEKTAADTVHNEGVYNA